MKKTIKKSLQGLNRPVRLLLLYGTAFCCLMLAVTLIISVYNKNSINYSITLDNLCKTSAITATLIFAEIIIGSLAMDCYEKFHKK